MHTNSNIKIGELFPIQTDSPNCFACGQKNPIGIKLRFRKEGENLISTTFVPPENWTGWSNIMHGGFQALLLDETMSWSLWGLLSERHFVTASLDMKYLKPIKVQQELKVFAKISENLEKIVKVEGEIQNSEGVVLASAKGVFVRVDPALIQSKNK